MQTNFILVAAIVSSVFSVLALLLAGVALIKCIGAEKSTHSVQYMPIDPEIDKMNEQFLKEKDKWATSEESLAEQMKAFKEDLEDQMPEFAPDDEDKKIYSF